MPDLGDQLRRWADQAEPVTADEARHRSATGVVDGRRRPDRRAWLAVAAVAVLLVGIGVAVAVRSGDDPGDDVRTVPSPSTAPVGPTSTTQPDPSSTTSTPTSVPIDPVGLPSTFLAHDAQHRLVVLDSGTGELLRVLATFDDPDAAVPEGEPAGMGRYLGRFTVAPDRTAVYYETCCEPAVGEIFRLPFEGGEPERVTYGTDPAISPDGTKLAVVELQALKVRDLRTGEETRYEIADSIPVVALAHPSWSPDGTMLALERYDDSIDRGRVVVVTFDGAQDVLNAAVTLTEADEAGTPSFPTFVGDDELLVVRQRAEDGTPESPTRLERHALFPPSVVDSGSERARPVLGLSRSGTGHVALLDDDGTVELGATDDDLRTVLTGLGLLEVAW